MSREVCPLSANMAKRVFRLYYWNIKAHSPLLTGGQTKIIFFGAAAFFKVSSFVIFFISISSKQLVLFDWGKKKAYFFPGTEVCISVQKQKVAGRMRCCCYSCGSKNSCKFSKKHTTSRFCGWQFLQRSCFKLFQCFFVWKACPGICKIWRKQEKLFRFDSNLCISSGLFLKLNFNDFCSWREEFMGWTVACWFSYEPQVYGAGPCHQLPNGGQGAVALATIFWFKCFQGLSTLGYNPFSCRTKRWHANRLAFRLDLLVSFLLYVCVPLCLLSIWLSVVTSISHVL